MRGGACSQWLCIRGGVNRPGEKLLKLGVANASVSRYKAVHTHNWEVSSESQTGSTSCGGGGPFRYRGPVDLGNQLTEGDQLTGGTRELETS